MPYNILIAVSENGDLEASAVRAFLENLGCTVMMKYIGRPNDFIDVLEGSLPFQPDIVIFCGHGDNSRFLMPALAEFIYLPGEPKEISAEDVSTHLRIQPQLFLSTACTTGIPEIGEIFRRHGIIYIAPDDYVPGSDMLFFVCSLFFWNITRGASFAEAAEVSKVTSELDCISVFDL